MTYSDYELSVEDVQLRKQVLEDTWEYADADTQHLTHNIHRYSGKFIPQIASRAISLLTKPGELVVDPYSGSGTTLVESALLNRRAIGIDLNPLAVLIASTKITPIPSAKLDILKNKINAYISKYDLETSIPLFSNISTSSDQITEIKSDPRIGDEWYCKWFQPKILEALIVIDHAIEHIDDIPCKNIARIALSDILRRSSNAHSGYPNVMYDKNAKERTYPIKPFLKALDRSCDMVATLRQTNATWENVKVELGTAVALPLADNSVDAIVTHPPYIGSVPYAEYGAISLKWIGVDPKKLDDELTGGRRQSSKVVEKFRESYGEMLREASRVLKPGRHAFVMVGNPIVKGNVVDLAQMTIDLANAAGLKMVVATERVGVNRRANKMGVEHLQFFVKPQ